MRLFLLSLAAVVLPLVWGFGVDWLLERIWPPSVKAPSAPTTKPIDYHI